MVRTRIMDKKIRFGCHRFFNSRPFTDYLSEHQKEFGLEIRFDHPARLADGLRQGELDVAFIPSIEYPNIPGGKILPGISISSRKTVKTVLLVCGKKLEDVKTIAVDFRSRTSVVLLKIILEERGLPSPVFSPMPPDIHAMLKGNDAALVIGDAAFGIKDFGLESYDLSSEWFRITGRPFVHAVMVASPQAILPPALLQGLQQAKTLDPRKLREIALEESKKLGISLEEGTDYLTNQILYHLGREECEGLEKFLRMAWEKGFLDAPPPPLRFMETI